MWPLLKWIIRGSLESWYYSSHGIHISIALILFDNGMYLPSDWFVEKAHTPSIHQDSENVCLPYLYLINKGDHSWYTINDLWVSLVGWGRSNGPEFLRPITSHTIYGMIIVYISASEWACARVSIRRFGFLRTFAGSLRRQNLSKGMDLMNLPGDYFLVEDSWNTNCITTT